MGRKYTLAEIDRMMMASREPIVNYGVVWDKSPWGAHITFGPEMRLEVLKFLMENEIEPSELEERQKARVDKAQAEIDAWRDELRSRDEQAALRRMFNMDTK